MHSSLPAAPRPALPDPELLDLISALVCIVHEGITVFLNRAGARMLGLSAATDAIGIAFDTFVEADYRILTEAGWGLLAEEDFLPLKLRRVDASQFEAELRVRRLSAAEDFFLIEARDISRFLRSAEALREREERLQGVLASVAEGIVTTDDHGVIETANPAFGRLFGHPPAGLIGRRLSDLLAPAPGGTGSQSLPFLCPGQPPVATGRAVEAMGRRPDGTLFPLELSLSELRHGRVRSFTGVLRDISERKENEERINRLAHHDTLTGLPNRNLLTDRVNHALARVRRHGGHVALLYVDLDRFKPINDHLGHEAGDAVLCEVATRLSSCIRSSDTVSRVGGDEFVVVVEEIARPGEAAMVARKIIDVLSLPILYRGHSCQVGASIGIAVFPDDGNGMEDVCKAADIAMYRVKNTGRNGFCFYSGTTPFEDIDLDPA